MKYYMAQQTLINNSHPRPHSYKMTGPKYTPWIFDAQNLPPIILQNRDNGTLLSASIDVHGHWHLWSLQHKIITRCSYTDIIYFPSQSMLLAAKVPVPVLISTPN